MATGDTAANEILDLIYGSGHAAAFPATVYLTLYHDAPTDAGGGTEASYGGYARVAIANNDTNFPVAADREKVLATLATFATPAADTDLFVAWAIHGHITNDDIITWDEFSTPLRGVAGRAVTIEADSLVIALVSGL